MRTRSLEGLPAATLLSRVTQTPPHTHRAANTSLCSRQRLQKATAGEHAEMDCGALDPINASAVRLVHLRPESGVLKRGEAKPEGEDIGTTVSSQTHKRRTDTRRR